MADKKRDGEIKVLLRNRKARHDYLVEETIEAGIELRGSEVKSLRDAQAAMGDAYAAPRDGQMYLLQLQVNEYPQASIWNHEPKRPRRLLLHRREIDRLAEAVDQEGRTLLPLEIYLKSGRIKVLLGLCKGKQARDKRQSERERDDRREMDRAMARHRR
jgi:SsrA-binding protein